VQPAQWRGHNGSKTTISGLSSAICSMRHEKKDALMAHTSPIPPCAAWPPADPPALSGFRRRAPGTSHRPQAQLSLKLNSVAPLYTGIDYFIVVDRVESTDNPTACM
jgi:hypothetical protein